MEKRSCNSSSRLSRGGSEIGRECLGTTKRRFKRCKDKERGWEHSWDRWQLYLGIMTISKEKDGIVDWTHNSLQKFKNLSSRLGQVTMWTLYWSLSINFRRKTKNYEIRSSFWSRKLLIILIIKLMQWKDQGECMLCRVAMINCSDKFSLKWSNSIPGLIKLCLNFKIFNLKAMWFHHMLKFRRKEFFNQISHQ